MLPISDRANKLAAWSVSRNWYEVVWWIGTATEPVVGSARHPAWRTMVSGFLLLMAMPCRPLSISGATICAVGRGAGS